MSEAWREAGEAYRREMLRRDMAEAYATEAVTFELPKQGPISWSTLERCAREAGMPIHEWVQDALAAYVRMHEREVNARMAEARPPKPVERRRIPAWRLRIGEWAYRLGDWLTGDDEA